jgi:hypothetical protein
MPNTPVPAAATGLPDDHPDAALLSLGRRLEEVDARKEVEPNLPDEEYDVAYNEHWRLREQINAIEAVTIDGLRVKARAADFAYRDDEQVENTGSGSFIELYKSISRDLQSTRFRSVGGAHG